MPNAQMTALSLMISGVISKLPPEDQEKVAVAKTELEALLEKHGNAGMLAFALVGAEKGVD